MDRGACWAIVHSITKSWTRQEQLSPEMHRERREPLQDKTGESTLLSRSGGEKGPRCMEVAGPLGTPLGLAQRKRASPRPEQLERPAGFPSSDKTRPDSPVPTLQGPCGRSAREDGGVSGVSSSCGARGGFLPRHDEDLREPLVRRQGSQVSI